MSAAWAEVVTACDALSQLVTSSTIGAAAVTQRRNTANRRDTGGVQIDVRSDLNCEDDDGFNFGRDGKAQVAECDYTSGAGTKRVTRRLVVRRTRLTRKTQQKLWPDWRSRVAHRPQRRRHRRRPVPSQARDCRTRNQGPQGRRRSRASPVGCVLGELGVVPDRDPGAQHVPLDRPPRRPRHQPPQPDFGSAVRRTAEPTRRHQPDHTKSCFATPRQQPHPTQAPNTPAPPTDSRSPKPTRWNEAYVGRLDVTAVRAGRSPGP